MRLVMGVSFRVSSRILGQPWEGPGNLEVAQRLKSKSRDYGGSSWNGRDPRSSMWLLCRRDAFVAEVATVAVGAVPPQISWILVRWGWSAARRTGLMGQVERAK